MKFILYITVGLLFLSVSACKSKQKITKIAPAKELTKQVEEAIEEEKDEDVIVPIVAQPTSVKEETRAEIFEIISAPAHAPSKYFVVVGSFKSIQNAEGLHKKLLSEGNSHAILALNEQQMYRVILASFETYAEANQKRNSILNLFPDAWILVQK